MSQMLNNLEQNRHKLSNPMDTNNRKDGHGLVFFTLFFRFFFFLVKMMFDGGKKKRKENTLINEYSIVCWNGRVFDVKLEQGWKVISGERFLKHFSLLSSMNIVFFVSGDGWLMFNIIVNWMDLKELLFHFDWLNNNKVAFKWT